ncbi:MAG: hypothetical protein NT138_08905 [Planctomycetales bacterium]|jgi:hypothetical protein|nr:hypothetical protein [Planctomycetales bacterium]RLS78898.1 MAG: hypothetical protein DWI00_03055 [Planctomycetota bacterium]
MSDYDTDVLVTDRRRSSQRRTKPERRPVRPVKEVAPEPEEEVRFEDPGISARREIMDRRRQDRRRQIDPTTCERDYSDGEIEFMRAMDDYKRKSGRPFPTWSEVLEVVMSLGYRKVADPSLLEWRTFGDQMGSL